jgi:hypothetical protein
MTETDTEREECEVAERAKKIRARFEASREAVTFGAGGDALKALENLAFHGIEGDERDVIQALDVLVGHFAQPRRRPHKRIYVAEFGYVPRQEDD